MRFPNLDTFHIDELDLDEENYRFTKAQDQAECVSRIARSIDGFRNLLASVAEDDLGEPLLVLTVNNENRVMDGNRRAAALKVLRNPDTMAPNDAIRAFAKKLVKENEVAFEGIQAQTSDDPHLIARTVYERHAAGGGISRINWNALAAARFRYDSGESDAKDWQAMVLLSEIERQNPGVKPFIDSNNYSHDIFRRAVRGAIKLEIISAKLFHAGEQRFSLKAPRGAKNKAIKVGLKVLKWIENSALTLSRKGNGVYADQSGVEHMLQGAFSPDESKDLAEAQTGPADTGDETDDHGTSSDNKNSSPAQGAGSDADGESSTEGSEKKNKTPAYMLERNAELKNQLDANDLIKVSRLYDSLTSVTLNKHAVLVWVGAWTFLETFGAAKSENEQGCYFTWLKGQAKLYAAGNKGLKNDLQQAIDDIKNRGDCHKHSESYFLNSAQDLKPLFKTLDPFIIELLKNGPFHPTKT